MVLQSFQNQFCDFNQAISNFVLIEKCKVLIPVKFFCQFEDHLKKSRYQKIRICKKLLTMITILEFRFVFPFLSSMLIGNIILHLNVKKLDALNIRSRAGKFIHICLQSCILLSSRSKYQNFSRNYHQL